MPLTEHLTRRDNTRWCLRSKVVKLRHHPSRAVIDTNAVLDWLVFSEPAALALADAVIERRWAWCATPAMLDELRTVLGRALPERWEPARKLALTKELDPLVSWMPIPDPLPAAARLHCRDPADQMFIDLALTCAPSWLITHDRALLALRRHALAKGVIVATPERWRQQRTVPEAGAG